MRNNSTGMAVFFIAILGFLSVKAQVQEERPVFHYSVMDAMRNGVYTGELSIGELAKKGNFGIGTYNYLDGEMIVLDGVFYRVDASGVIGVATNSLKIPFGSVAFFKADMQFELTDTKDIEELQNQGFNSLIQFQDFIIINNFQLIIIVFVLILLMLYIWLLILI